MSQDPKDYRLSTKELERLAKQVVRLRMHAQMRVGAIKSTGDTVDVPAFPPPINNIVISQQVQQYQRKMNAQMEAAIEPQERGLSHKYRRRKLHELNIGDIVGIVHARLVEERQRRDVAEEFRVSVGLVSRLSAKCKDGLGILDKYETL